MISHRRSEALAALGHPGRLAVFRLLARRAPGGVRPSEIAAALDMKPNTLSVHVSALTRAGLLMTWREGRSVYYAIALTDVADLVDFLVNDCCRGRPELCVPLASHALQHVEDAKADRPRNVLFLCTGNSARSVFAEAVLSAEGGGRFCAYSAGTHPYAAINPSAAAVLERAGHDPSHLKPKGLARFTTARAQRMDFVFTVCDRAANDDGPALPGRPMSAHWGVPDPVSYEAGAEQDLAPFEAAFDTLRHRVRRFLSLPFDALDALTLQQRLDEIGREDAERTSKPLAQGDTG